VYGQATSIENLKKHLGGNEITNSPPYKTVVEEEYYLKPNKTSPQGRKANAAIVILGTSLLLVPNCRLRRVANG
jgi:alpha 1,2-mannosyltransferase